NRKFKFYERYGVEEYYIYDPERLDLAGWLHRDGELAMIEEMSGWVSPRLQISFEFPSTGLELYYPDGRRFLTSVELHQQAQESEQRARQLEEELAAEKVRSQRLAEQLKRLGIDPDSQV
ncbi:Uma2 family endonuclease, partial [Arthrospira platensis FACHB-835]|nr:Uma2 family endonuclease [Arthrospira platensis FACHB-835]